ncbi:MAG: hypothetical protein OXT06_20380 [Rhodospirillaceae bacterium]|nr:hypothetical protein [Rhodospirillaceae bacterium]MDD9915885.1 hypothetical protein [Rhodospirillaceae bacterium]MDD9925577.1 hypothetical protein [Rhodospirillaceae bacterium]
MTNPKLKVSLDNVSAGWVAVSFAAGSHEFSDSVSYVTPVFDDLCDALSAVLDGALPRAITLCAEPIEYDVSFLPIEGSQSIRLVILEWPDDGRRSPARSNIIFSMEGSRFSIVYSFWRGLRKLQSSLPAEIFEREWRSAFPDEAFAKLTQRIDTIKSSIKGT